MGEEKGLSRKKWWWRKVEVKEKRRGRFGGKLCGRGLRKKSKRAK